MNTSPHWLSFMFKILLINLLIIVNLSAMVYEDAEDVRVDRWKVVSPKFEGTITNVFDEDKVSRVIKLDGNGIKSIYQLVLPPTLQNIKMDKSFFTWEMKYSENFVIFIVVNTTQGKRYLIYTPSDKNSYLQYGLNSAENTNWQKYSRNLEKDLQMYEKDNKIIEIESFVIKGSGLVDNIQLKRLKSEVVPPLVPKEIKAEVKKPLKNYTNDILPVLKLNGKNPVVLKVGDEYIEEGATARNRDGSKIDIKITQDIDILMEGEYTVIYIATNKLGNSSVEKRQVIVGNISKKTAKKMPQEIPEEISEEMPEENFTLPPVLSDGDAVDREILREIEEEEEAKRDEKILSDELRDASRPSRPGL